MLRTRARGGLLAGLASITGPSAVPVLPANPVRIDLAQALTSSIAVTSREAHNADAAIERGTTGLQLATIVATSFQYLSTKDIEDYTGDIVIDKCETSLDPGVSQLRTPNDPRMGTLDRDLLCVTCHQTILSCPGHPGRIDLGSRYLHPEEIRACVNILDAVCNACSRLKATREYLAKHGVFSLSGRARLDKIAKICQKLPCSNQLGSNCMQIQPGDHSGYAKPCLANPEYDLARINGNHVVPYSYSFILKDKEKGKSKAAPKKMDTVTECGAYDPCRAVSKEADEKEKKRLTVKSDTNIRTIEEIKTIFKCISAEDCAIMGFENEAAPINLVMESLMVMPPCARPHVVVDGVVKMDHLTTGYGEITRPSEYLKLSGLNSNTNDECKRRESARDLYFYISHLIDNGDHKWTRSHKEEMKACKQRLIGKDGCIRLNSMGKRIDFGGRTVIEPDPISSFGYCSVPFHFYETLTVPVMVARYNREYAQSLLRDGKVAFIIPGTGKNAGLRLKPTKEWARYELQISDVVERMAADGDVAMLNRQPTISKFSMQGFKLRGHSAMTIGLPMIHTKPYNADFDGDEMNLHLPQTTEARAEVINLLWGPRLVLSPHTNSCAMGLVFGNLSASYLLTLSNYDLGCEKECYYAERAYKKRVAEIVSEYNAKVDNVRAELLAKKRVMESQQTSNDLLTPVTLRERMALEISTAKEMVNHLREEERLITDAEKIKFFAEIRKISEKNAEYRTILWNEGMAQIARTYPISRFEEEEDNERRVRERNSFERRLEEATKRYGVNPRSGRALFSMLLPEDFWYEKGDLKIRNGILLPIGNLNKNADYEVHNGIVFSPSNQKDARSGAIFQCSPVIKDHIGVAGNTIHQIMHKRYGPRRVRSFLTLATWFLDWFIERRVFTLTHAHTRLNKEDSERVEKLVSQEIENAQLKIRSLGPEQEGMSMAEKDHREKLIQSFINNTKAVGDRIGEEVLDAYHPLNVMGISGTKGSSANTASITGLLGQQFIKGSRPAATLAGGTRVLPYFDRNSTELAARGFISSNFAKGLSPSEMYFLAASAREGLTDTATKTADVGAILRRMIKLMEDVKISYTGANINAVGNIFQYVCHDGFDPAKLLNTKTAAGSVVSFIDLKESVGRINLSHGFDEYA